VVIYKQAIHDNLMHPLRIVDHLVLQGLYLQEKQMTEESMRSKPQ
jgi:hypothetical protein